MLFSLNNHQIRIFILNLPPQVLKPAKVLNTSVRSNELTPFKISIRLTSQRYVNKILKTMTAIILANDFHH